ncbi:MAG: hypothetical protein CMH52_05800 [Myxococcales bacterium]|nr:hypothetical protein [Myxococcales bacterium]
MRCRRLDRHSIFCLICTRIIGNGPVYFTKITKTCLVQTAVSCDHQGNIENLKGLAMSLLSGYTSLRYLSSNCLSIISLVFGIFFFGCSEEEIAGATRVCQSDLDCRTGTTCIGTACIPIERVDEDGDGIPDHIEEELGTDRRQRDSDGDGVPDNEELQYDPMNRSWAAPDGDEDGVPDALEPDDRDRDDDGVPDAVDPCDDDPDCPVVGGAHPPCRMLEDQPCAAGIGQCAVVGRTQCSEDGQDVICIGEENQPVNEICDGLDNDCDGEADELFLELGDECPIGLGTCASIGRIVCDDDGQTVCAGTPLPPTLELCDGLDNDCDDAVDESFDQLGTPCFVGQGGCLIEGITVCDLETGETSCSYEETPETAELCDGVDNDCDGNIDETFPDLGSDCTLGLGICARSGIFQCSANGQDALCDSIPGPPAGELCDGLDNDCDGETDEVFGGLGSPCAIGRGACRRDSMTVCAEDGSGTICPVIAGQPEFEQCDRLDNDCDGEVDEDLGAGEPCSVGVGACIRVGQSVCNPDANALECNIEPAPAMAERCDALDNDCDGQTDEDFDALGRFCEVDRDGCILPGAWRCSEDGAGRECIADPELVLEERCDQRDNDCDGLVDEELGLGEACVAGEGLCEANGQRACSADGSVYCEAIGPPGTPEVCDGIDNDCDFRADEDFVDLGLGSGCTTGVGTCAANGVLQCDDDGNGLVCVAELGLPNPEVCDGLDNDCDGAFDETFLDLGSVCEVGLGACRRASRLVCSEDTLDLSCPAVPGDAAEEICNAFDDDCDGTVDESFAGLGDACSAGIGACRNDGIIQCTEDGRDVACSVSAGDATPEICDQIDNDCDGEVDEGFDDLCRLTAQAISAGGYGTCATLNDGQATCWGSVRRRPPEVALVSLSAGGDTYCGLDAEGLIRCWGQPVDVPGELGIVQDIAVSANAQVCILRAIDNRVRCFGRPLPDDVPAPDVPLQNLTAGFDFACAINRVDRRPQCWGTADFGVLDVPDMEMTMIDSGSSATCGLIDGGAIQCWGEDIGGQLDPPDGEFVSLSMGGYTGCAINREGDAQCWGLGSVEDGRQYGQGLPPLERYSTVSMGAAHGCGLTETNAVICWGAGGPDDGNAFPHSGQSTLPR